MKSLQKRIYNVLGAASTASSPTTTTRARSNSLSSSSRPFHTVSVSPLNFFDSPPPSSPRSSIPSSSRLPVEAKPAEIEGPPHPTHGQSSQTNVSHPPLSLALTQPQSNGGSAFVGNSHGSSGHPALFSYSLTSVTNLNSTTLNGACAQQQHVQAKKHKPKYQFYVGAYGIPKKCDPSTRRRPIPQSEDDMGLAVQIGEDAYFIRDDAMGVADGVGGWAKARSRDIHSRRSNASKTTPSALFARRLMHYCSAEVETVSGMAALTPPKVPPIRTPPRLPFALSSPVSRSAPTSILMPHATPWQWSESATPSFSTPFLSSSLPSQPTAVPPRPQSCNDDISALEEDLEETLEELSEGIDVLQILERAYDRTLKAHVVPAEESLSDASRSPSRTPSAPLSLDKQPLNKPIDIPQPSLPSGTAKCRPTVQMVPLTSGSSTALLAVLDHVAKSETISDYSKLPSISTTNLEAEDGHDTVLKIAHVGDCMAMLVRGEEIVWRSEEMWWNFNTPVQLGPSTPTTPRTSAHVFTLPVRADDILILATDGLSDNLWDEDVLDEVVRFRRNFLGHDQEGTDKVPISSPASTAAERVLRRRTLAGMLSEALCSRARRASERSHSDPLQRSTNAGGAEPDTAGDDEVPFARRAREAGKIFRGGKNDDISVIVAVISPAADLVEETVSA